MRPRTTKLAAVASVVVLSLGAAACSGDDDPVASPAGSASAPKAAGGSDLTQASFITTVGDAQSAARTSHVTMKIGAGEQVIGAEGDVEVGESVADTSMAMTMDMGAAGIGPVEMRLVDGVVYVNLGEITGDKFATSDLNDPDDPLAQQLGSLTTQLDPAAQLASLGEAVRSFEKSGEPEQIDGVEAQPYEMVLDTEKFPGMGGASSAAGGVLPETLTYTVFIGPDDLPRRMVADLGGGSITLDYSQWGEPVDIAAPPASDISDTDLTRLVP